MKTKRILLASTLTSVAVISGLTISTLYHEPDTSITADIAYAELIKQFELAAQHITSLTETVSQLETKLLRLEKVQRTIPKQPVPTPVAQLQTTVTADAIHTVGLTDSTNLSENTSLAVVKPNLKDYTHYIAAESLDVDWSLATEASALTALTDYSIVDTELDSVECYQSACKLEFQHLTDDSDESFIERLQSNEAFAGEFFTQTMIDEQGVRRTVLVVGRADEILLEENQF